jgi:hypothetical protein
MPLLEVTPGKEKKPKEEELEEEEESEEEVTEEESKEEEEGDDPPLHNVHGQASPDPAIRKVSRETWLW